MTGPADEIASKSASSMNQTAPPDPPFEPLPHSGLRALCGIAAYYRVAAESAWLVKELALTDPEASARDLVRAAKMLGLKARIVHEPSISRLAARPAPAIVRVKGGGYSVFGGATPAGLFACRPPDPYSREMSPKELAAEVEPT